MAAVDVASDTIARTIAVRREIHRFPEAGFEEEKTAALVERELDALGIEHRRVAKTGVVGVIRGGEARAKSRACAPTWTRCRSASGPASRSAREIPGKMHACGHDAHTAMLLGAARELTAARETLARQGRAALSAGRRRPGRRAADDRRGRARRPARRRGRDAARRPRFDTGTLGIAPGPVNAAADELYITIGGVGGHGAAPHRAVDTIPCAAAVILALQNIAARETDPLGSVVITIGTIEGGYRNNVIADKVADERDDPHVRSGRAQRHRGTGPPHRRRHRRGVQRAKWKSWSSTATRPS